MSGDQKKGGSDEPFEDEECEGNDEKRPTVVPKFDVESYARTATAPAPRKRSPFPTMTDDALLEAARRASMARTSPPPPMETPPEIPPPPGGEDPMGVLGSLDSVPRHAMVSEELTKLGLDHHSGFMLALVDGVLSFETIIDVCGMPRAEAVRVLAQLVKRGIINVPLKRRA